MKKLPKTILALALTVLLLLPLAPLPARAQAPATLNIALISDPHYFPESMAGGYGPVFDAGQIVGHPIEQAPGVLRSVLEAIKARALRGEVEYLLIPGDLTREGERGAHEALRDILLQFEKDAKIPVAVIPGNHDIDNGGASTWASGEKKPADQVTAEMFYEIYKDLGYDLPGLVRYTTDYSVEGNLSYAADLGAKYRLIAIDTRVRRISPALREWVVGQCEQAAIDKKTVVGMGHHNLGEQFRGQLTAMQKEGIENMREISEQFADAGMHFYFSGHLHMSEISPWYSDKGEVLWDIIVPGLYSFPGDYRVASFATEDETVTADVSSYAPDEVEAVVANGVEYKPYYPAALEYSFGYGGEGLAGFVKAAASKGLGDQLKNLSIAGMADLGPLNALLAYLDNQLGKNTQGIIDMINGLIDEAFALPVSKLPCTRFIEELGFGDKNKPGTLADAGNSILAYMFWKKHDPAQDAFIQDVLRRMKNGELLAQVLDFAIPRALDALGAEILPLLADVDVGMVNRAMSCGLGTLGCPLLFVLAVLPGTRDTISRTLYDFASGVIASQSPSGRGTDARLVYDGHVDAPTSPETFRLPYDLSAALSGDKKSAEITWYTKASLTSPQVKLNDMAGVSITYSSEDIKITVNELDLGIMKMMGETLFAAKHTAKLEGLDPGKAYKFIAGDSKCNFWGEEQDLAAHAENPVLAFLRQVWAWLCGMWKLLGILWNNCGF